MNMIEVQSSNVVAVGYENGTLAVEFTSGSIYEYANVPQQVYEALLAAPSKGRFLRESVYGKYGYRRV